MRSFALLAVVICLCGCNSHPSTPPQSSADQKGLQGAVVDAGTVSNEALPKDLGAADANADRETLRQVRKLTAEGKLAAAVELCGNYIGTHAESAPAFRLRAEANAMRHNDADAVADYSTAIRLEPKFAGHHVARGFFQLTRGNTSDSIKDFDAALQLDPKYAPAYNDRGMARVTTGELKQALGDFNRAIELDPKAVSAYTNRSFALVKLDRRRDAMADLDKAIELDPKAAGAYDSRGALRLEDRDYQKALADFTAAIKLVKTNPNYYSHRRETYLKLERYADAQSDGTRIERLTQLAALTQAVFQKRLSPRPYLDRGDFLLEEGQLDNALANFDRALELDPRAARGLIGRARVLIRRGDFQKAVADSTAALAIEPREEAFAARGDAYRKLGDYAKAVADYDSAQRFDADVAETWLLYSGELRKAGRAAESDQALKRSNELKSLDAPRVSHLQTMSATVVK